MPTLDDPRFHQSVSYICERTEDGAIGIIINRPMNLFLDAVLDQIGIEVKDDRSRNMPVYFGGPIAEERGFVIHSPEGQWRSTLQTATDLRITTSQDILEAIAVGEGPKHVLVALGYAGWGGAQLEQEISQNSWLTVPVESKIIFQTPIELRWKAAAALLGVDLDNLSGDVGHA